MNKKRWFTGIVSGALLGGLLLGSVGMVSAAADQITADQSKTAKSAAQGRMMRGDGAGRGLGMNMDLNALAEDGVISSEQATAIQAWMDQKKTEREAEMEKIKAMTAEERQAYVKENKPEKTDFCTSLVNDGIISSEQADAIQKAIQTKNQEQRQTQLKEALSSLVDKGTITSAQSELILSALQKQPQERKAEMEKVKAMTEAERQAYFQQNRPQKTSPLADLISAGSLTQDQADAIMQALGGHHRPGGFGPGKGMGHERGMGNGSASTSTTQTNNSN